MRRKCIGAQAAYRSHGFGIQNTETRDQMSARGRGPVRSFEDLEVFQRAYRMALEVHRISLTFPQIEQRVLGDQLRRASKSICANIAEGFGNSEIRNLSSNVTCELRSGRRTRCVFGRASVLILISSMKRLGSAGATPITMSPASSKRFIPRRSGEASPLRSLFSVFCFLSGSGAFRRPVKDDL